MASTTTDVPKDEKDPQKAASLDTTTVDVSPVKAFELDYGKVRIRKRERWWQFWVPSGDPPPPPASIEQAPISPLASASFLSVLTYSWVSHLMVLGYRRTLQAADLPKVDESRKVHSLSERLDAAWAARVIKANDWNRRLQNEEIDVPLSKLIAWYVKSVFRGGSKRRKELEAAWRNKDGLKEASLAWSLNDVCKKTFWIGGLFKVLADLGQLAMPILLRALVDFSEKRAIARSLGQEGPPIGNGIGFAFGLFFTTLVSTLGTNQFFWRSMETGVLARGALISSVYKRGVNLTGKSRVTLPNSKLVNLLSSDISRIEMCAQWFHAVWTAPIQLVLCLIILLVQLGPSALAGFSLFFFLVPIQQRLMKSTFLTRRKSVIFTDARSKVLLEVFSSMRIVKFFTYELSFLKRIAALRKSEIRGVRKIQNIMSANISIAFSVPTIAAMISLITYTVTTGEFDAGIVFSSVSLFAMVRQPMMFLPRALSTIADASTALNRLKEVFNAELLSDHPIHLNDGLQCAVKVENATFAWERSQLDDEGKNKKGPKRGNGMAKGVAEEKKETEKSIQPFSVQDISMNINKGSLVAVIGRVGSGKSSLLSGLLGEMRRTKGSVQFGGRIAYCGQTAWIQNATLRDNVIFGSPYHDSRYWTAIEDSCLIPDLQLLPDGDLTEIGEKGINISGGQKQRVNICRALYADADILILDDPLSAVDAHVGRSLFNTLSKLRSSGKTIILVTHALYFLSQCDYIYAMSNGKIAESGTYAQLLGAGGETGRLIKEFGGAQSLADSDEDETSPSGVVKELKELSTEKSAKGTGKLEGKLIVKEIRETGSVSKAVYVAWMKAAKWWWTFPLFVVASTTYMATQLLSSVVLTWWQADSFNRPFSFYEGLYAAFSIGQAFLAFGMNISVDVANALASRNVHNVAIDHIFYAPMSFFDTTPTGRIMSVFGKDVDTMDNQLSAAMKFLVLTLVGLVGSLVLITIYVPYFILVSVVILVLYQYFGMFFRASAREMKRLDSMLRSLLYSHFSESMTGLSTIRSYNAVGRFVQENTYYIDLENRALLLTITLQRWLTIRVDTLGAFMVFFVAIMAATGASNISAAEVGLILLYSSQLTQMSGMVTRQSAEVETYMNSVERLVHYSRDETVPLEAPHIISDHKPPSHWPDKGNIEFKEIELRYRSGLPLVLKGISATIKGGQRIGIAGRTGSGKSSLMLSLLRIVEYSGLITIDGQDISKMGLFDLRSRISIIPQDPVLFSGSIRQSLDPFSLHDDATLWDALRRVHITSPIEDEQAVRITLDTQLEADGANLSVGERSLLSIARALVKDSSIVILDEATASVDLETDRKIQETISQFEGKTLLCIAHRLRTILNYDKVLVLDEGQVVEFDTPLALFQKPNGVFRSMCDKSEISLGDIQAVNRVGN